MLVVLTIALELVVVVVEGNVVLPGVRGVEAGCNRREVGPIHHIFDFFLSLSIICGYFLCLSIILLISFYLYQSYF